MAKLDLGVKIVSEKGDTRIYVTEHMQFSGGRSYDANLNEKPLTKKKALALGLLLIKAAQQ